MAVVCVLIRFPLFSFSGPGGKRQIIMNVSNFSAPRPRATCDSPFVLSSFILLSFFNVFNLSCYFSSHPFFPLLSIPSLVVVLFSYVFYFFILSFSHLREKRRLGNLFVYKSCAVVRSGLSHPPTKLINVTSRRDVDWFITSAASLTAHSIIIDACLHAAYLLLFSFYFSFLDSKLTENGWPSSFSELSAGGKHFIRLLQSRSLSLFCLFYFFLKIKNVDVL